MKNNLFNADEEYITGEDVAQLFKTTTDINSTIDYILDRSAAWSYEDLITWYDNNERNKP